MSQAVRRKPDLDHFAQVVTDAVGWRARRLPVPESKLTMPSSWHLWLAGAEVSPALVALMLSRQYGVRLPVARAMLSAALDGGEPAGVLLAGRSADLGLGPVPSTFGPALARPWQDLSSVYRAELVRGGSYVATPKLDGVRCQIVLLPGRREILSRQAERIRHQDEMLDVLAEYFRDVPCVLDGELLAHDGTWGSTISALHGKAKARVHLFDLVPASEVTTGHFCTTADERWRILDSYAPWSRSDLVAEVPRVPVETAAAAEAATDAFILNGYEGAVLHSSQAVYHPRLSKAWLKIKRWRSQEFTVVGCVAGQTETGAPTFDAFDIVGRVDGREVHSRVGTGFTQAERGEIWRNQASWVGAQVEVRFGSVTDAGSLRWPVYLRRRDRELGGGHAH